MRLLPPPLQKSRSLQERARRAPTAPMAEEEGEEGAGEAEGAAGPASSASRSSSGDARRNQPDPSSLERLRLRRRRARRGQRPLPPAEHLVFEPWTASAMEASDPADCIRLAAAAALSLCPSRPRPRWRAMTPAHPPRVVGGTWPVSLFLHDLRDVSRSPRRRYLDERLLTATRSVRRPPSPAGSSPLPSARLVCCSCFAASSRCSSDGWRPSFSEGARSLAPCLPLPIARLLASQ